MECRGCGKQITFAFNEQTKKSIPVEKVVAYETTWSQELGKTVALKIERDVYISHFLTCKKANDFSSSNKQPSFA